MRAKRRVVTAGRPSGAARTPTARRRRSAIEPTRPSTGRPPTGPGPAPSSTAPAPPPVVELSVDLGRGLVLANPVLAASGAFGYGVEAADVVDLARLGAICTRGTTRKPRGGNRPSRAIETAGGLLNGVGLQNPGVDAVVERYAATWATWSTPVIVNIAGESAADYVEIVRRLEGVPGVAAIELNLSCPNVTRGGVLSAVDAAAAAEVTSAVRRASDLPLLVKLSPNVTDIRPIARAIADAGADALTAIDTLAGLAVAADRSAPFLGSTYGGVSGPALKPVALRVVYEVAQVVSIPVVAAGGVATLDDVLDFLAVGAVAVQVGTATFADPTLPIRLVDELGAETARRGLASHRDLIGSALPRKPGAPSAKGVEYRP